MADRPADLGLAIDTEVELMATQMAQSFRHIAGVADKLSRLEAQSEIHGQFLYAWSDFIKKGIKAQQDSLAAQEKQKTTAAQSSV